MNLLDFHDFNYLKGAHTKWIEAALKQQNNRDLKWTQSIAVGDKKFIEKTKKLLGDKANGMVEVKSKTGYELKETQEPYGNITFQEVDFENKFYWNLNSSSL